jgi:Protein of unknown function (DUF742)
LSSGHESSPLVRPYALTAGRTRARYQLPIEALVSTTPEGRHPLPSRQPEHQRICELCSEVKSVAEVAALMRMPLGVVRVLIGDMSDSGLVAVQQPGNDDGQPNLALLERVLIGLRNL